RRRSRVPQQGEGAAQRGGRRAAGLPVRPRCCRRDARGGARMTTAFAVASRDVVVARGPDARSFLQALVSQDLDPLAAGDGAHSLLLQPQGKLVADFRLLLVADDEIWCDCETGIGTLLLDALNRFKIRVKVDLELLTVT